LKQDQKIAAFGSSYRVGRCLHLCATPQNHVGALLQIPRHCSEYANTEVAEIGIVGVVAGL
ncbi:hypothetical protein, partial [Pseudomonas sp. SDO5591_S426]